MFSVIHDAIPEPVLRAAAAAWPAPDWSGWHRYKGLTADKYGLLHASLLPHACRVALDRLAGVVCSELEGTQSFVDYDLHAAGLHQIPPGGFLGRHLDAEYHPFRPWKRTHSIILFLDTLSPEDGGQLIIDPDVKVVPTSNQAVIFKTPGCWHEVTRTKPNVPFRRTLALFAWELTSEKTGNTSAEFSDKP